MAFIFIRSAPCYFFVCLLVIKNTTNYIIGRIYKRFISNTFLTPHSPVLMSHLSELSIILKSLFRFIFSLNYFASKRCFKIRNENLNPSSSSKSSKTKLKPLFNLFKSFVNNHFNQSTTGFIRRTGLPFTIVVRV